MLNSKPDWKKWKLKQFEGLTIKQAFVELIYMMFGKNKEKDECVKEPILIVFSDKINQ